MQLSPGLLKPLPTRRAYSHLALNVEEFETSGTVRRRLSVSTPNLERHASSETPSSFWSLELLYKITDVVLVICAAIFIISSISSIIIWWYGLVKFPH